MIRKRIGIGLLATTLAVTCAAILPVHALQPTATPSGAETLVLQPGPEGVDAYVFSWSASENFGAASWFHAIGLPYTAALLRFDLSSIPSGSTILSAQIELWAEFRAGTLVFAPVASAWDEMAVTWNTKPGTTTPEIERSMETCASGCSKSFEIADVVRYAADHPELCFGIQIAGHTPGVGWMVASSDNAVTSYRPKLTVQYVPGGVAVDPACWSNVKSIYR